MSQTLVVLELSQWHTEVKHMRLCQRCFSGMESKVSFIISSKMLYVSWNSWSHIILGQILLQKEKLIASLLVVLSAFPVMLFMASMETAYSLSLSSMLFYLFPPLPAFAATLVLALMFCPHFSTISTCLLTSFCTSDIFMQIFSFLWH